ncbi:potassium channel family protein [Chloroflexota bacterium]
MKKQIAVIGLGQFGGSLARALFNMKHDVLAIDSDEKRVQNIIVDITHAVQADATDESVLTELGIKNFDIAIVAMGESIQDNVLTTVLLKKLGVPYIIARAENNLHQTILEKIGADKVIFVERDMGERVAQSLDIKNELDSISVVPGYLVARIEAFEQIVGRSLSDLELGRGGVWDIVVLVVQSGRELVFSPPLIHAVKKGDVLVIAGKDEQIDKWLKQMKSIEKTGDDNKE